MLKSLIYIQVHNVKYGLRKKKNFKKHFKTNVPVQMESEFVYEEYLGWWILLQNKAGWLVS